ncbi:MAG: alpha-galactosidase [Kiritimatiellia bacterium]
MNRLHPCLIAAALATAASAQDSRIEYRDCPKCTQQIRIAADGAKAYINESRLGATTRAEAEKRALRLLELGQLPPKGETMRPLMGWSSWNTFGVNISEAIILETARAMATNGLKQAGYEYVNIDDGFFYGRNPDGTLRFHPQRFPNGMRPVVDGIHALGLKAGIYSDAGSDTCGSMWSNDPAGKGSGLYGHDRQDFDLHFDSLGFDFIKVDYCGGAKLKLDEKARYTEIAAALRACKRQGVRFNICRWAFPGVWAADIAESWRTTGDIRANWKSVRAIIAENLYLGAYAKPGHYNDMDMLEIGQRIGKTVTEFTAHGDTGLTADEEVCHFGMWCMLSSPLLIGSDVRNIAPETLALATNPYLLGMSQNDLGLQAYVAARQGETYILVKDADRRHGTARYVALYNADDTDHAFVVRGEDLDLGGKLRAFDLVERADPGPFEGTLTVRVPAHGGKFYRFDAEHRLDRRVYEAEDAFLPAYQELTDAAKAGTAHPAPSAIASGGTIVRYLGNRPGNELVWPEVTVSAEGEYDLEIAFVASDDRQMLLAVDDQPPRRLDAKATGGAVGAIRVQTRLTAGSHRVSLSNPDGWMPDIDRLNVARHQTDGR